MAERDWTRQQADAIGARGGPVLVTAAAGSGKTAVLVERAVRILCDEEHPVDADKILLMTFSNAAAAEMRQRISLRLSQLLRQNPGDHRLARQQALLPCAKIGTVHAFCLDLIRQNFHNLPVTPDFALADDAELAILKAECAAAAIAARYDGDPAFPELVELLSSGRDDKKLADVLLRLYEFGRSHPFFEDWLDDKLALYSPEQEPAETEWGRAILDWAAQSLAFCAAATEASLRLASWDEAMEKAYGPALRSDEARIARCQSAVESGCWDGAVRELASFEFQKLGVLRGDGAAKRQAQDSRKRVKDLIGDLKSKYLCATAADYREDIADLRPKIEALFALCKDFARRFAEAKAEKRRLDFPDLEHLALRLLVRKTGRGCERTAQAEEIAARFEHVLVDEYQDTNEVQDLIFTSVSRGQQNLFMVGDVKQSIYRFRQAMPEIFMEKKRKFFPYGSGVFPAKIVLGTNFRSRGDVTGAVNDLFRLLMSAALGEIDYDDEERLVCGAAYPPVDSPPELLLLDLSGGDSETDAAVLEAEAVAKKIREMIDSGYPVTENGQLRPCRPGDFCVLLRSVKNRADIYAKALQKADVPASADASGGFLSQREVAATLCLLKALDNPLLDIELVSAMLSPFFDFCEDDVARIRMRARNVPFFSALCLAAEDDRKAAYFLELFREFRALAAILPAAALLTAIYERTAALEIARAMPMGESRAAALRLLRDYAAEYHGLGYKQLGGFVGFLNRLQERGGDLSPPVASGEGHGAVRVMSVHRSKGLEFPVVILADTARQFNKMDLREPALFHSKMGFACYRRDNRSFKQYATVPMQAVRLESERAMLSEELRILYVALTRAREKLMISAALKSDPQKKLAGLVCNLDGERLPPFGVRQANSIADWVLMTLPHFESAAALRELGGLDGVGLAPSESRWQITVVRPNAETGAGETEKISVCKPDLELLRELDRRRSFVYPFADETRIPAKLAVSAATKAGDEAGYRFHARPKFLTEHAGQALTPAEKGSAMHRFMQFADYAAAKTDLEREIARMEKRGFLSAPETASLSRRRLAAFFDSTLAARIFASGDVRREIKFMAECGGDILGDLAPGLPEGARIALQGVADCVFFENGGAVIVDYKTDRAESPMLLAEKYEGQLRLYRAILERSLAAPVRECLIYSFWFSREVQLPFDNGSRI